MFLRKTMGKNFLARWAGNWGTLRENLNTFKKKCYVSIKSRLEVISQKINGRKRAVHKLKD